MSRQICNPQSEMDLFDAIEPVEESASLKAASAEGWVWEARMLQPGFSLNRDPATGLPRYYPPEFVREAAPLFEGAPAFADHSPSAAGSVRDLVGKWEQVRVQTPGSSMRGELHLLKSEEWLRQKLLAAERMDLPLGISINAFVAFDRAIRPDESGKQRPVLEARRVIAELPRSADVVTVPGAGGRVLRALASADIKTLLAQARQKFCRTGSRNSVIGNPQSEIKSRSVHGAKGAHVMEETRQTAAPDNGADQLRADVTSLEDRVRLALTAQQAAESRLLLERKLADSKLAEPLARLVRERMGGQASGLSRQIGQPAPTSGEIDAEIRRVREAFAAVVPSPTRLATWPGSRVQVVENQGDRMQIALDKLFGVKASPDGAPYDASVPAFSGIREAYISLTGDRDLLWIPRAGGRVTEEWNSTGFANALGNTLHRRMIQDYFAIDYGLDLLIPEGEPHRLALRDFRTHEVVRVGYLGDLPQVDPEAVDWPEIAPPTDEKATLTAIQFGGIVTVTRKHVINDDIGTVAKVTARLGRAARRTLARRVFKWLINNSTIYDGLAFFHATHNNLGSTALSANEINTVRQAMRDQTEKDSGEKLGISPQILVVPHALEGTARQENERDYMDASFTPNPVHFQFGAANERVVVSPLLTDANDWYVFANPREVQTFQLGFLQGREEPELLLADNELVGKTFSSDRIQYKVRHEYEVTVVDFRGAYKEAVA